jgi:hypothetical protein
VLSTLLSHNKRNLCVLVIKTFEKEMTGDGINALKPLDRADDKSGVADPDEVTRVVVNRSGSILSASTIIKSDFFCNLQKMTLPEYVTILSFKFLKGLFTYLLHRRIEGVPNFRRVPMVLRPVVHSGNSSPDEESSFVAEGNGKMVCGWSVTFKKYLWKFVSHSIHVY